MSRLSGHDHTVVRAMCAGLACAALLLLEPPATVLAQENLAFAPPPGWKLGEPPQQTRDALLLEFVKEGDALASWQALISMQQFRRNKNSLSARASYDAARGVQSQRCPDATQWQILEENEGGLVYEWKTTAPCDGHPPQVELVRLINASKTGYRVAYATRSEMTPEAREEWTGWLRGLKLVR